MKYALLVVPMFLFVPFVASASEEVSCDEGTYHEAVTHTEYRYQEQWDADPRGGHENWKNVGDKTEWTSDTEVDGHEADETFDVPTRVGPVTINVTHRWHTVSQREVTEEEAYCESPSSGGSDEDTDEPTTRSSGGHSVFVCNASVGKQWVWETGTDGKRYHACRPIQQSFGGYTISACYMLNALYGVMNGANPHTENYCIGSTANLSLYNQSWFMANLTAMYNALVK